MKRKLYDYMKNTPASVSGLMQQRMNLINNNLKITNNSRKKDTND